MHGGLEYIDLGGDEADVVGIRVAGKMTREAMAELIERLEGIRSSGRKARLYVDLTGYEGYELAVVGEKLAHFRTLWNGIERCAYVVSADWMTRAIGLIDAVTPMHLRAFTAADDAQARAWVREAVVR